MIPEPEHPWERNPRESQPAWEAFCTYRDMGQERSVRRAARSLHKSLTVVGGWSSRWRWPDRCAAWDSEQDRVRRDASLKAITEMARRHASLAVGLQVKLAERLKGINAMELTPRDLATWLDLAVKVERLSLGEPTEIAAREVSGPRGQPLVPDPARVREIIDRLRAYGVPALAPEQDREIALGGNGNGNGNGNGEHR